MTRKRMRFDSLERGCAQSIQRPSYKNEKYDKSDKSEKFTKSFNQRFSKNLTNRNLSI